MKFLLIFFLFLITTFAQNWQSEISLFNIPSYSKINSCVSNKGIHVIYTHNGGVKYALSKPDGTVIKNEIVIENEGAGCSVPAIASVNNEVYAFYVKNNNIYTAKSTNLGDTWVVNSSYYNLISSTCDTLIALMESNYINVVWSGSGMVHYVQFNNSSPSWTNYKKVSDLDYGSCDRPAITVSPLRIHIGYRHLPIAETRDKIKADGTWVTPQMVSDVVEGTVSIYESTFSINNQLHAIVMYKNFDGGSCWISHYIRATDNLTWQQSGSNLYTCMGYGQLSASTANNNIHLIYYDFINSIWTHRTIGSGDWSSPIAYNILFRCSNTLNVVGNDLYLIYNWDDFLPSAVKMHQFNDAPISPLNFAIATSPAYHPYLSWTSNDPEVYYNSSNGFVLERRLGRVANPIVWDDWTIIPGINGSLNNYEDLTVNNAAGAGPRIAEYRLRANDNLYYSPYTNSFDIHYGTVAEKITGKNTSTNSELYYLLQNFPNPFNPSTVISYQIPNDENVKLRVYNMMGQEVMTLVNGFMEKGMYSVTFNAGNLASGLYIYKLEAGNFIQTRKMLLTK